MASIDRQKDVYQKQLCATLIKLGYNLNRVSPQSEHKGRIIGRIVLV